MLSILIPTYNYNISDLVREIHEQATKSKIKFEIICFDDNSREFTHENKSTIDSLSYSKIIVSKKNLGRTESRQKLAKESIYNWLLFLDADVLPKSNNFIINYINNKINTKYEAIFGGFSYTKIYPNNGVILRWKYGKTFEDVNAKERNIKPYRVIISANFLIQKNIFTKINSEIKIKSYGLDNYFASLLKQYNVNVLHINNEVYHFGLERNEVYLNKIEESLRTLLEITNNHNVFEHDNKLLSVFQFFKRYKFNHLFAYIYPLLNSSIKKNLLGENPNLVLLQFYKILYICYIDSKNI